MTRKTGVFIGIAAALVFAALMTYGMFSLRKHRVEVCMTWNGRTECAKAAGSTQAEATRTAIDKVCALISGGMTDSMNCSHSTPTRITALQ